MTLRTFLGSGGVQYVHLPRVVSDLFGCSTSEATRLVADGQVELDDEVTQRKDLPLSDVQGKRLRIGREVREVGA